MVRSEQYASFQIYRPVLEDNDLNRFMSVADEAGYRLFSNTNFVRVESTPESDDLEATLPVPEHTPTNGLVPRHEVYNRGGLKLPLLDLRSPRPIKTQAMMRAFTRFEEMRETKLSSKRATKQPPRASLFPSAELLQAVLRRDMTDNSEFIVSFNALTLDFDPKHAGSGYELALVPDPEQVEARILHDEAAICFNALASNYRDLAYPTAKSSLFVSFGRTPNTTNKYDEEELSDYIATLKARLPLNLILGEPQVSFSTS